MTVCVAKKLDGLKCTRAIVTDSPLALCSVHYKWARDLWFEDFDLAIHIAAIRKSVKLNDPRLDGWVRDTDRLEVLWHKILRLFVILGIEEPHAVPASLREEVHSELLREVAEHAARQLTKGEAS